MKLRKGDTANDVGWQVRMIRLRGKQWRREEGAPNPNCDQLAHGLLVD